MPTFHYEAADQAGKKIKGMIEAENPEEISEKLREMGYSPISITQVQKPLRKLYYVAKDVTGKTVSGNIKATEFDEAIKRLQEMGYQEIRISTAKNLDMSFDDTKSDKVAKFFGKVLLGVIFLASFVFTVSFPHYWESVNLLDDNSKVVQGIVLKAYSQTPGIQYGFDFNGKRYEDYGRISKEEVEQYKVNATVAIRYSMKYPSISCIDRGKPRSVSFQKGPVRVSGIVIISAMVLLFYCSSFRYIGRIRQARRELKPTPKDDVKRLLFNAASALLFPLIFICMIASMTGQGEASFYYPYRFYFIVGSVILLILAVTLQRKAPVYYD